MPITYNNPNFHWELSDKTWDMSTNPKDIFWEGTSTIGFTFTITTFAPQGFLIEGHLTGTISPEVDRRDQFLISFFLETMLNRLKEGMILSLNAETGIINTTTTFTTMSLYSGIIYTWTPTINYTKLLSFRKRYLKFANSGPVNTTIIYKNTWESTTFKNMNFYQYKIDDYTQVRIYIKDIVSVVSEEWVYYNIKNAEQTTAISSIDEFPLIKCKIRDTIIYQPTRGTTIVWPTGSIEKAILKSTGSHFLFNGVNELQKRDFSSLNDITTITDTQTYAEVKSSDNNKTYTIQDSNLQVLQRKNDYNLRIPQEEKSSYHYFDKDKTYSQGYQVYYTDLWDNNNPPMPANPKILYDNMTQLQDDNNLDSDNITSKVFWLDQYTLYCAGKIYYIPTDWEVKIWYKKANSTYITDTWTGKEYWFLSELRYSWFVPIVRAYNSDDGVQTKYNLVTKISPGSETTTTNTLNIDNSYTDVTSSGTWRHKTGNNWASIDNEYSIVAYQSNNVASSEVHLAGDWYVQLLNETKWPYFIFDTAQTLRILCNATLYKCWSSQQVYEWHSTDGWGCVRWLASRTNWSADQQAAGYNMENTLRALNGILPRDKTFTCFEGEGSSFVYNDITFYNKAGTYDQGNFTFFDCKITTTGNPEAYIIETHKKTT